jgi:CRISPR type III-B/RAMP module RAMP protein Cmr1
MIRQSYQIEIITPCFCAGGDQSQAEIRPASIRGQLRWWFRLISRDPQEEAAIFGAVSGDNEGSSSALSVRVSSFKPGPKWNVPSINQIMPENYVWHYASVSGTTVKGAKGPRWKSEAVVAPGSSFSLDHVWRRTVSETIMRNFDLALRSFLALGTLGLRATRGLGSLHCPQFQASESLAEELSPYGFIFRWREKPEGFASFEEAIKDYAAWLRYDFRAKFKASRPSPLGSSTPRQASALRFRPFKQSDNKYCWLIYEAPHDRVLGHSSRSRLPLLSERHFNGQAPQAPPRTRY